MHLHHDEFEWERLRFVGQPTFNVAAAYGGNVAPVGASAKAGGPTHLAFIVWVILLGIVLPGLILGGLKVGGFKFVFKGR